MRTVKLQALAGRVVVMACLSSQLGADTVKSVADFGLEQSYLRSSAFICGS